MKIETKLDLVKSRAETPHFNYGNVKTLPPTLYHLSFYSDRGIKIDLCFDERNELYSHLNFLFKDKEQNFCFEISNDEIDKKIDSIISKLNIELDDERKHRKNLAFVLRSKEMELYDLKLKWWYKLFTKIGL